MVEWGQKNIVFLASLVVSLAVIILGIGRPDLFEAISGWLHTRILDNFGWGYLLSSLFFLVFSIGLAVSRFGELKLGQDHEKPQYGYFGWFAMLFAAGMGIGLIFWGVAEPLSHYTAPPGNLDPRSGAAAAFAMRQSFFHWGLHPWAIYIVMSLAVAYFSFRRGMPPLISSCFYPLLGERINGPLGYLIDILSVLATIFGIVTSLGLGAIQITSGLAAISPLPDVFATTLGVIAIVTVLFMISSLTGLDKGIQMLSKANIILALLLLAFMLIVGPTVYILSIFTTTLGQYFSNLLEMSLASNPFEGYDWTKSWTMFYWAWWISWAPFVGLFVASISRGRTIREFILGAMLVPTLLTFVWFSVFGGAGLHLQIVSEVDISGQVAENVSVALFQLFEHYPLSNLLTLITVLLLMVFFITSADSATYVLAMMTSNGELRPANWKKIVWGITVSTTACILLFTGGLEALQRMAITAALPFAIIMLLLCYCLWLGMSYELSQPPGPNPDK
ncbi:MAG: BCCT family transporter [Desulfurivibrio sp.]|nr:BCCT family transporter [Desulfurivibrio sp.]